MSDSQKPMHKGLPAQMGTQHFTELLTAAVMLEQKASQVAAAGSGSTFGMNRQSHRAATSAAAGFSLLFGDNQPYQLLKLNRAVLQATAKRVLALSFCCSCRACTSSSGCRASTSSSAEAPEGGEGREVLHPHAMPLCTRMCTRTAAHCAFVRACTHIQLHTMLLRTRMRTHTFAHLEAEADGVAGVMEAHDKAVALIADLMPPVGIQARPDGGVVHVDGQVHHCRVPLPQPRGVRDICAC